MIDTAINAAIKGTQSAEASANKNAAKVAKFGNGENDLAGSIVALHADGQQLKANAAVLKAEEEMHKGLLDAIG